MDYVDDCTMCIYLNKDKTCGNNRSIMFGVATNYRHAQSCSDRRYYDRDAFKKTRESEKLNRFTIWIRN